MNGILSPLARLQRLEQLLQQHGTDIKRLQRRTGFFPQAYPGGPYTANLQNVTTSHTTTTETTVSTTSHTTTSHTTSTDTSSSSTSISTISSTSTETRAPCDGYQCVYRWNGTSWVPLQFINVVRYYLCDGDTIGDGCCCSADTSTPGSFVGQYSFGVCETGVCETTSTTSSTSSTTTTTQTTTSTTTPTTTTTSTTTATTPTTLTTTPAPGTGACCDSGGNCYPGVTEEECNTLYAGTYVGDGTNCSPDPCNLTTPAPCETYDCFFIAVLEDPEDPESPLTWSPYEVLTTCPCMCDQPGAPPTFAGQIQETTCSVGP